MSQDAYYAMKIEMLDLPIHTFNHLRRNKITIVGEVITALRGGRARINTLHGLSEMGVINILQKLEANGYLPEDLPLDVDVRTQAKRLRWLSHSQSMNGSWFDNLEMSIATLLSVIRSPNTVDGVDLDAGFGWLEKYHHDLEDAELIYAVQRLLAEYHSTPLPECPFNLSFTNKPNYGTQDAANLSELRRVALIRGNAVLVNPYWDVHRPGEKLGLAYTPTEIMWMTVGKPKKDSEAKS